MASQNRRAGLVALGLAAVVTALVLAVGIQVVSHVGKMNPAPWAIIVLPLLPLGLVGIYVMRRK